MSRVITASPASPAAAGSVQPASRKPPPGCSAKPDTPLLSVLPNTPPPIGSRLASVVPLLFWRWMKPSVSGLFSLCQVPVAMILPLPSTATSLAKPSRVRVIPGGTPPAPAALNDGSSTPFWSSRTTATEVVLGWVIAPATTILPSPWSATA